MKKTYWGYGIIIYAILLLMRDLVSKNLQQIYNMNQSMLYDGIMQHKLFIIIAFGGSLISFIMYFISLKISTYIIYDKMIFLSTRERIIAITLIFLIVSLICQYFVQGNYFVESKLQIAMFAIIGVTSIYVSWALNKVISVGVKHSVFKISFIMSFLNVIIICSGLIGFL